MERERMTTEEAIITLQQAVDETFGAGIEIITRGGCEAVEMAIEALKERKTAKRIDCIGHYKCSNCHTWVDDVDKYCPNCGAELEVDE